MSKMLLWENSEIVNSNVFPKQSIKNCDYCGELLILPGTKKYRKFVGKFFVGNRCSTLEHIYSRFDIRRRLATVSNVKRHARICLSCNNIRAWYENIFIENYSYEKAYEHGFKKEINIKHLLCETIQNDLMNKLSPDAKEALKLRKITSVTDASIELDDGTVMFLNDELIELLNKKYDITDQMGDFGLDKEIDHEPIDPKPETNFGHGSMFYDENGNMKD